MSKTQHISKNKFYQKRQNFRPGRVQTIRKVYSISNTRAIPFKIFLSLIAFIAFFPRPNYKHNDIHVQLLDTFLGPATRKQIIPNRQANLSGSKRWFCLRIAEGRYIVDIIVINVIRIPFDLFSSPSERILLSLCVRPPLRCRFIGYVYQYSPL